MSLSKKSSLLVLIFVSGLCFSAGLQSATASLLAEEQFVYTLGANAGGQNGGSGFSTAWSYSSAASGSISSANIIAGLTFSDLAVFGNAARLNVISSSSAGFGDTVFLRRKPVTVPVAGQEFWYRYLFHMDQTISAASFSAGMDIDDVETISGYTKFGAEGLTGVGSGRGGVSVDTSATSAASGSPSLSDTGTYLMIAKFTGVNQASSVTRTGTFWALSTADYDAIKAGGITEAELNAHNRQTATETAVPIPSQQPLNFNTVDSYELRGFRPPVSNAFQHYDFDEIFAGTSLADLGLPAVPEPTSLSLLLPGLALLYHNRRRQAV